MKLLGLIVCVQPVTVVAKFSSGSDDSNSRALAVIAATLPFLLPAVGLVLFGSHLAASLGLVLAAVSSAALMAGYGVVYGASRFDALRSTAE
jgi:hypothetical protein